MSDAHTTLDVIPQITISNVVFEPKANPPIGYRVIHWCFQWADHDYPGRQKGFLALLPRSYTRQAMWTWRSGVRRMPAAVARSLADYIRSRCETGMQIVADLEAHADAIDAEPKRLKGACAVDAETGRDRRGNWRR